MRRPFHRIHRGPPIAVRPLEIKDSLFGTQEHKTRVLRRCVVCGMSFVTTMPGLWELEDIKKSERVDG